MKIAIYKDDFDPINNYYLKVISSILNDLSIDEIWVVINKKASYIEFKHRLKLCKLELEGINKIKILYTDIESNYDYINNFKSTFINDEFYWVINTFDFNKLDANDKFILENKFIVDSVFIRESLHPLAISSLNLLHSLPLKGYIIDKINENKIPLNCISTICYRYLKKIL